MFPPSIEQLLGAASNAHCYRTVLTRDAIAIEASGPEDHARAMEFAREAMREGWGDRIHARPTPVMMSGGLPVPMAYPATLPMPVATAPAPVQGQVDAGLPDTGAMESPPAPIESPAALPEDPLVDAGHPDDVEEVEDIPAGSTKKLPRPREHPVGQPDSETLHRIHHRAEMQRVSMRAAGKPTSTLTEHELVTDLLIDVVGNKPVGQVTETDIRRFVDEMKRMPKNVGRRSDFAKLSRLGVNRQAKKLKLPAIDKDTFVKHLKTLIAFFNACKAVSATGMAGNPCDWIVLKHHRKKRAQKRDILDEHDRQRALDVCMQSNVPVEYWGYRIADLTGMRANEICQLELRDIRSMTWKGVCGIQEHIDYFDINEEGEDQHVKSSCSVRRVPMPHALIDDGFLQYVEDVRKAGGTHVFPGLSWNERRPGRALSVFVNPMFREVGITDPRKVLHSTRNTWTTQADLDSVPRSVVRGVNGHADGSDIDDNTYTARATLVAMKKSMEAMDIPYLQFRPYRPAHFAKAIKAGVAREKHDERLKKEGKSLKRRAGRPKKETGGEAPSAHTNTSSLLTEARGT